MSAPFALVLRRTAALFALRSVSKHEGAQGPGPTSSFETRARRGRAPQDEVGTKAMPRTADEVIE
jgi:hypothetical protein